MGQACDFKSTSQQRASRYAILGNGSSAKLGWQMQDYNTLGAAGNAAAATAEKGRAMLEAAGQQSGAAAAGVLAVAAFDADRRGQALVRFSARRSSPSFAAVHRLRPTTACEAADIIGACSR